MTPNANTNAKANRIDCQTQVGYLLHNLLEFYPCEIINTILLKSMLMAMQSDSFDELPTDERKRMATVLNALVEVFAKADEAVYSL